jgi:hypothetical protein
MKGRRTFERLAFEKGKEECRERFKCLRYNKLDIRVNIHSYDYKEEKNLSSTGCRSTFVSITQEDS